MQSITKSLTISRFCQRVFSNSFAMTTTAAAVTNKMMSTSSSATDAITTASQSFQYPSVRRDNTSDVIHGHKINDPYRWLEDADSTDTKQFVDKQNEITMPYIESCVHRQQIDKRLNQLWHYCRYGCPFKRGDNYYYYMNTGLQNQSILYVMSSLDGEPQVFLDPNQLSPDGTTSLGETSFSEDGKWFAYGLSDSGSDWVRIRVKNVSTGEDVAEELTKIKFTNIAWTHDNNGFFYGYYPDHTDKSDGTETTANQYQKLFYHRLNTKQTDDILIAEFPDEPNWRMTPVVSDCGKYLHVFVRESCQNCLWFYAYIDGLAINGPIKLTPIIEEYSAEYEYITNDDSVCYVRTNKLANNYRVIKFDLNGGTQMDSWTDVIAEHPDNVLDWCTVANNDVLIACYIKDVVNVIELRRLSDGQLLTDKPSLDLPMGAITGFSGKRKQSEIFYYLTSFLIPGVIYHYDFKSKPKIFKQIEVKDFNSSDYETKQVFYDSMDGTKVPMFIVHHKDLKPSGDNVCLLYGYGGFNISIQPSFNAHRLLLMNQLNGIFALANIRGGGEYGEKWHDSGKLLNKQNVFDDFHAAANYLIDNHYTNPRKLIIQGGSNGGLLVAAVANQRPDLYGCVVCHVGVLDMLRFHKFTIGKAWCSDYGNPDEEIHFNNVLKYSPLHNIPDSVDTYPATLILTGDHDDRVVPLHSFKFIAQLQHQLAQTNTRTPLMIRVDTKSGHGAGKPTTKMIQELTDIYSFIINALKLDYYP
ncbi:prolyl endopeptidase-like [Oppia nitens]|uniref:prolyl endopeptidase-like n=1 Tax=Oppia nitens TaxID=1686743 RepID=UPI0023DA9092|nr:prolyl endopeptidase-like [Oppia nitens]